MSMRQWTRNIREYSREEVKMYCVNNAVWQTFRLTLKGVKTEEKLILLDRWMRDHSQTATAFRIADIQVSNYINALKRGGQLDLHGKIVKEL